MQVTSSCHEAGQGEGVHEDRHLPTEGGWGRKRRSKQAGFEKEKGRNKNQKRNPQLREDITPIPRRVKKTKKDSRRGETKGNRFGKKRREKTYCSWGVVNALRENVRSRKWFVRDKKFPSNF